MSDRIVGFTVAIEGPTREEDNSKIAEAIAMIKGVVSVGPIFLDPQFYVARELAKAELKAKIQRVFEE